MKIKYIKFNWDKNFTIFSSEKYLKSICSEYGWLGGFVNNKLKFILPFVRKKEIIF